MGRLPWILGGKEPRLRLTVLVILFAVAVLAMVDQLTWRVIDWNEYVTWWDHAFDRLCIETGITDTTRPQLIPRTVYQTWFTRSLPAEWRKHWREQKSLNPGYAFELYLDAEMDDFVRLNFAPRVWKAYSQLNIITAKADFWRYLILYKLGGVYIDMDSAIIKPLAVLIEPQDEAIVTLQNSAPTVFAQWALMFAPNHPILNRTISYIVDNIEQRRFANSTIDLTGPNVYSRAINDLHFENFGVRIRRSLVRATTDISYHYRQHPGSYRIFGLDYRKFFRIKYMDRILNQNHTHWREEEGRGKAALRMDSR